MANENDLQLIDVFHFLINKIAIKQKVIFHIK